MTFNKTLPGDIVAIMYRCNGKVILTTDLREFQFALEKFDADFHLVNRKIVKFMAACDLGHQWKELATARTLFIVTDQGEFEWPEKPH